MTKELFVSAITKLVSGILILGILIFLPAGTFHYPQGQLLMGILFIPMTLAGIVMMLKSPELLRKRLSVKEEQNEQKKVILFSGLMFAAAFIAAGLSFRLNLLMLPKWVSYIAAVVFLLAYALFAEVLRENAYLSRTVEVQEGQRVVDTGLYGLVRHPMYAATLLLFLSMPLILGSPLSFCLLLLYLPVLAKRIRNNEKPPTETAGGFYLI